MKKNVVIICVCLLIFINLAFFAIGYYSYLHPKLGDFTILNVVRTNEFLAVNVSPSLNATKYAVSVYDQDTKIYEKTDNTNQITLDNLEADYQSELTIEVAAYNKNNEVKNSENTYSYIYEDASFEKDQNHLVSKTTNLSLKIAGYDPNEEYVVKLYHKNAFLYQTTDVREEITIPYDVIKNYSGRITAILYTKDNRKLSTFNFYLNTPVVGKIKITLPTEEFSTRWNDVTVKYQGGENANHFFLYLYQNGVLAHFTEVFPEENSFTIPASILTEETDYEVVLEAVYEDYSEIAERAQFTLHVSKKETTEPVYVSHNPSFIKRGTTVTLESNTPNTTIYYTVDGTDPTTDSLVYQEPLTINADTIVKTYAVSQNRFDSAVNTYTFLIGEKTPVIYLSPSNQGFNYGHEDAPYTTEKEMMNKLADVIEKYLKAANFIVYRNNPNTDINTWNSESNYVKADFHLAIHSNASKDQTARGIEIYVDKETSPSLSAAANVYKNLWSIYPASNVSAYNRSVRYARGSLGEANDEYVANGALIEVAFHDNYEDAMWMVEKMEEIGQNIANSIISYYN